MEGHLRTQIRVICTHRPGSSVHTYRVHLYTHTGFICTHRTVWGWGGVGWANNVHVPVHTHRHSKPDHLSCCPANTGTTLGWSVTGGVGWGNNVHVPVHTQAYQPSWLISYRWGGVGWGNNVHVPVHTQAHPTWSSFLLSSRHRHYSWLIYRFLSWNLTPPDFLVCCL